MTVHFSEEEYRQHETAFVQYWKHEVKPMISGVREWDIGKLELLSCMAFVHGIHWQAKYGDEGGDE